MAEKVQTLLLNKPGQSVSEESPRNIHDIITS